MDATETKMTGQSGYERVATMLEAVAPLFVRLSDEEYAAASKDVASIVDDVASVFVVDKPERLSWARALEPLQAPAYASFRDDVLVPGMPLSTLPVESLYKQWSAQEGNAFGATRGLYLGDPAHHIQALYEHLDIDVPQEFSSMPDHLTLELELLSMFLTAGNHEAAREFVADHLDWLADYDQALTQRSEAVQADTSFSDERRDVLVRGITLLQTLVVIVDRAAHQAVCASENCRDTERAKV